MTEKQVIADLDWDAIEDACVQVLAKRAKRIDGENWKVYAAGTIIRVDIPMNNKEL